MPLAFRSAISQHQIGATWTSLACCCVPFTVLVLRATIPDGCMRVQVEWAGPKWEVVAACFSLKGGRADWLVEKATELGAWGLRPILTVRSPYLGGLLCRPRVLPHRLLLSCMRPACRGTWRSSVTEASLGTTGCALHGRMQAQHGGKCWELALECGVGEAESAKCNLDVYSAPVVSAHGVY